MTTANATAMATNMELLNIHPSASKPSLISSFWSLHVQLPNQEALDADLRCNSQTSLPDVVPPPYVPTEPNKNRISKSMTDIANSSVDPTLFSRECEPPPSARSQEDSAEKQRRISFSVQEWLRSIDDPTQIQMTNA